MRAMIFRAYDKATNRMLVTGFHVLGEVTAFGVIEQMLIEEPVGKTTLERMGDVILMQFTGRKDKNGFDIYEGDIVKINWADYRYGEVVCKVEWNNENACFDFGAGAVSEVAWSHEVIGNIHQHPELLNNKTTPQ